MVVVAGAELVVDVIVVKDEVDAAEVVGKEDEVEVEPPIGPTDEVDEIVDEEVWAAVVVVAPPLLEVEEEVVLAEVDDVLVELVGAKTRSEKYSISTTSNLRCGTRTMGLSQVSGAT